MTEIVDFNERRYRQVRTAFREYREAIEALHDGERNRGVAGHDGPFDRCTYDLCNSVRRLEDESEEYGWA